MNKNTVTPDTPKIALLIDSTDEFGRAVLSGVARYLRDNGPWTIFIPEDRIGDTLPDWFATWHGEGVISNTTDQSALSAIKRLGIPTISLREVPPYLNIPMVLADDGAIARLAFGHLRERGFQNFAYCGRAGGDSPDERQRSFQDCANAADLPCVLYATAKPVVTKTGDDGKNLMRWITELPKPVGIMAVDDQRGRQILNVCRSLKILVPSSVAVIGVGNDEVLCDLADPPLSSIAASAEPIGFQAATRLEQLMAGQSPAQRRLLIDPAGVIARRSTDTVATGDPQVATAAKYIREHAREGITVSDVVRAAHASRSTLERRYARVLGRSLKQDILHARLEAAKQLLKETNVPVAGIAAKLGIRHKPSFVRTFTNSVGMSPAAFRARESEP